MNDYTNIHGEVYTKEVLSFLVNDWQDDNPAPIIEQYDNITVVNDGLFPHGSKARFADKFVRDCSYEQIVYASPTTGFAQVSLAYLCKKYNKQCVLFEPERSLNNLHDYQNRAINLGASIRWIKMGMSGVLKHHAEKYVKENRNSVLAPFGFDNEVIVACALKVIKSLKLDTDFDEVWSVSGSGTLSRCLQLSFPNSEVYAVCVGHKLTDREKGRAHTIIHPLKFHQKTRMLPPFDSAPTYDAKAWQQVKMRQGKILFWNVAS